MILVVEDELQINRLLCDFLSEQGYQVCAAYEGREALRMFREQDGICLVLLDLMLPFQNGDSVLEKIREVSDVPVIVISAKDTVRTKIDLMRMGADDYITKPFDLDEVLVRVEAVLRRASGNGKKGSSSSFSSRFSRSSGTVSDGRYTPRLRNGGSKAPHRYDGGSIRK